LPERAATGRVRNPPLDNPPDVQTPPAALGPEPPTTPFMASQHPPTDLPPRRPRREASQEPILDGSGTSNSDVDAAGNTTFRVSRGRPRGRPSAYGTDPILLELLTRLTHHVSGSSNNLGTSGTSFKTPAMKAPEPFDGTSSRLRNFIQSCQLIFHNDEKMFSKDKKKVLYAASFLTGKAGKWIEPYLSQLDNEDPSYLLNSWSLFETQLFTLFGDPNEIKKAEADLTQLRMKDGGQASTYITDFRSLTTRISGWGERALMFHFRHGLPSRILDQLAVHQTPLDSLQDLMKAALDYDIRYHERNKEKNLNTGVTSTSSQGRKPVNQPPPNPKGFNKKPNKKQNFSTPPPSSSRNSRAHIARDGTLKQKEKDRRIREGLCTYCGEKHKLEDCQKLKTRHPVGPSAINPSSASTNPKKY